MTNRLAEIVYGSGTLPATISQEKGLRFVYVDMSLCPKKEDAVAVDLGKKVYYCKYNGKECKNLQLTIPPGNVVCRVSKPVVVLSD